jgi:hypothetical protein
MTDTTTLTIDAPEEESLLTPAERAYKDAASIVISDQPMYEFAGGELRKIKDASKKLDDERREITRPLDVAKKKIMERYNKPIDFLTRAEAAIKLAMLGWTRKVTAEREAAEAKAREGARKEAEKLAAQAAKAEAAGKVEKADVLMQAAQAAAVAAPVLPSMPKAEGTHVRKSYHAEVADKMELVAFVAANPMFLHLLMPDGAAINAQARALKEAFAIPGCRLVIDEGLVVSR